MSNITRSVFDMAEAHSDRLAVWARAKTLSYGEFRDRAALIGTKLRAQGLGRGMRVAVLGKRTPTLYASILGVMASGATYVTLNPRFPDSRNRLILKAAGAKALVVEQSCAAGLAEIVADLPDLEFIVTPDRDGPIDGVSLPVIGAADLSASADALDPDLDAPETDLMYVIFTSGSTGLPKGVPITHAHLRAYLDNIASVICPTEPDDRVIQISDVTFDVSIHDMFTAWTNGAAMISIPENSALMSSRFVEEQEITQWFSVPSTARLLAENKLLSPGSMPSLRSTIFAGEPLVASVASDWYSAAPNAPVWNIYGPTEGTISLCGRKFAAEDFDPHEVVSLGEPFSGNKMGLFNHETNAPVGGDEVGEICFTGNQVFDGYWQDPELNAKRFFERDGVTWYKTGDLGRYTQEKGFIFAGRADNQTKIRGFRVELGEIESTVRAVSETTDVAVLPWPVIEGGNAMGCVAFIRSAAPVTDEKIILDYCREKLADYMIPDRLIFLDELPLNANGKVDYKALAKREELEG
ncbi:amino acid adenylation domain-containing protein [Hyphobacterium sp.]|uniref:amino acid adenylation domain-containing protein n=1 Tax=Hyphobacterium sp. TaxID=2004662 RepID=UPI003BAA5370